MDNQINLELETPRHLYLTDKIRFDQLLPISDAILSSQEERIQSDLSMPAFLTDATTLRFTFNDSMAWLDPSSVSFAFRFRIVSEDGTPLEEDHLVSPLNDCAETIISRISLYANSQLVASVANYPYLIYTLSLLR